MADFFVFAEFFAGGVFVGSGDLNNDGFDDVLAGAGFGGGPHVRAFGGNGTGTLADFFSFDAGFTGGVRVGATDQNGDGDDELVVAAGPGGGPHVRNFDLMPFAEVDSFFAYSAGFSGGVFVG